VANVKRLIKVAAKYDFIIHPFVISIYTPRVMFTYGLAPCQVFSGSFEPVCR
jgi:hypothetical protein